MNSKSGNHEEIEEELLKLAKGKKEEEIAHDLKLKEIELRKANRPSDPAVVYIVCALLFIWAIY